MGSDGFVITHAESLQNGVDVAPVMQGNGAGPPILLEMNSEEEMQLAEVSHLDFALEARLQLVDHVYLTCQNDEIIYIYD